MTYLRSSGKGRMILKSKVPAPATLETYRKDDGSYSFPVCGDIARRLVQAFPDLTIDEEIREKFREVSKWQDESIRLAALEDIDLPGMDDLYPYQRVAVAWLQHVKRGILADEQGLGKTVMSVVAARQANPKRAVVICTNAKRQDWHDHIVDWIPGAKVHILKGDSSKRNEVLKDWDGYMVCGYKTAHTHSEQLKKANLVIVDEAHKIRNRSTDQFLGVKKVSSKAEHVYLVTASPTINLTGDIWTLLYLCDPKRFSSYWGFIFRFCEVTHDGYGLKIGSVRENEKETLDKLLSPYVLLREGMLDLPKPIRRVHTYEMSGVQKALYESMDENDVAEYDGQEVKSLTDLSSITRLRQLALHPGLIFDDYDGPSKLDVLEDLVRERDGKVVVFTQYADLAERAAELLNLRGIEARAFTGSLSDNAQAEVLSSFKRGPTQVIVLTHGVGGEGLNLTEADRAIFLELAWHPAGNQHALRRILRHGQKSKTVEIILVHVADSIEDHIWEIIRDKVKVTIEELMSRRRRRR